MVQEVDWPVLKTLLTDLPLVLENKTLVLSAQGHLVYTICGQLCAMVMLHTIPPPLPTTSWEGLWSFSIIQSALGGNIGNFAKNKFCF